MKRKLIVIYLIVLVIALIINLELSDVNMPSLTKGENEQNKPEIEYNKTYGGTGEDWANALVQTIDGSFALAGHTDSFGAGMDDMWLVKTDENGVATWNKTYGRTGDDWTTALVQTVDGGFALAGFTDSFGAGGYDIWLVKTDENGVATWNKTYGRTGDEWVNTLVQTADRGFALAGSTDSFGAGGFDMWLVKTNENGVATWNKTYGGTKSDEATALVQTVDGGFALAGHTWSFGAGDYSDMWLVKTDENGVATWIKTYGGTGDDRATALVQTTDGSFALAGHTASFGAGTDDMWLVKTGVPDTNPTTTTETTTITQVTTGLETLPLLAAVIVLTTWCKRKK